MAGRVRVREPRGPAVAPGVAPRTSRDVAPILDWRRVDAPGLRRLSGVFPGPRVISNKSQAFVENTGRGTERPQEPRTSGDVGGEEAPASVRALRGNLEPDMRPERGS